jgi:hypothetical protein
MKKLTNYSRKKRSFPKICGILLPIKNTAFRAEVTAQFLHKLFLQIRDCHPEFNSFSWTQLAEYNDEYRHFQLKGFVVNQYLKAYSSIYFSSEYSERDSMDSRISFDVGVSSPSDELEFANKQPFANDAEGIAGKGRNRYSDFVNEKYQYLAMPCLKMFMILKMLEANYSMYYFLYVFGNSFDVTFDVGGVTVVKHVFDEENG